jgi:hypothetical protein
MMRINRVIVHQKILQFFSSFCSILFFQKDSNKYRLVDMFFIGGEVEVYRVIVTVKEVKGRCGIHNVGRPLRGG